MTPDELDTVIMRGRPDDTKEKATVLSPVVGGPRTVEIKLPRMSSNDPTSWNASVWRFVRVGPALAEQFMELFAARAALSFGIASDGAYRGLFPAMVAEEAIDWLHERSTERCLSSGRRDW